MQIENIQDVLAMSMQERIEEVLVSVIMPVYNTPIAPLRRAVRSVGRQTHPNLEILLVDDGSDETTAGELRALKDADSRIRLLCGGHQGASHARNIALENAKGDWIAFCDSDDEMTGEFICEALHVALYYDVDYVSGETANIQHGKEKERKPNCSSVWLFKTPPSIEAAAKQMMGPYKYLKFDGPDFRGRGPWSRLYRRETLGDLRFDETLAIAEDRYFNYLFIKRCKSMAIVGKTWYWYYQNPWSVTHSSDADYWEQNITAFLMTQNDDEQLPEYRTCAAFVSQQAVGSVVGNFPFSFKVLMRSVSLLKAMANLGCFNPPVLEGYLCPIHFRLMVLLCRKRLYFAAVLLCGFKARAAALMKCRRSLFGTSWRDLE